MLQSDAHKTYGGGARIGNLPVRYVPREDQMATTMVKVAAVAEEIDGGKSAIVSNRFAECHAVGANCACLARNGVGCVPYKCDCHGMWSKSMRLQRVERINVASSTHVVTVVRVDLDRHEDDHWDRDMAESRRALTADVVNDDTTQQRWMRMLFMLNAACDRIITSKYTPSARMTRALNYIDKLHVMWRDVDPWFSQKIANELLYQLKYDRRVLRV